MTRLLVAALLLHHIEGTCKPWSAATLAARQVVAGLVEHFATRDRQAAEDRARNGRQTAIERAQRRIRPGLHVPSSAPSSTGSEPLQRPALGAAPPLDPMTARFSESARPRRAAR